MSTANEIKTKLTILESILTLFGITIFGILLSILIGKGLIRQIILTAIIIFLLTGQRPQIIFATCHTYKRDLLAAKRFGVMSSKLKLWETTNSTVIKVFQSLVKKHPNKSAFILGDKVLTFDQVEKLSNKIGNYFKNKGLEKGDAVALLMENRCEYSAIWLGLSKIGVITALVNTSLTQETLLHSIKVASSKAIIVSKEMFSSLENILSELENLDVYIYDDDTIQPSNSKIINLYSELEKVSSELEQDTNILSKDKLFYIYTSGTTGLPKAAVITHLRFQFMASGLFMMFDLSPEDIFYNTLPLYHTAGGMLGVGCVFLFGVTMAMRKKFSASQFWSDCIKYNCTVAQYIGEICRFLLMTPQKPEDKAHKVRFMFGNGLRPQIWTQFVSRFNIQEIGEVYGATESNANLANFDNKVGAVGFVPRYASFLYPVTLIRCDERTGEPIRNDKGFYTRCKPGEQGVLVGRIDPLHASRSFAGYADKKASEKKVLKNVFKKGDLYFNSSDILMMDVFGYYYFKDRSGDTFRWRGENVSTSEVEGIVMKSSKLSDCTVFGVEVPHTEGKAGMLAIVDVDKKLNIEELSSNLKKNLPVFARPIFIRILSEISMTGTFKIKKLDLQKEGFDITKVSDPIYFMQKDGSYILLTSQIYQKILDGKADL